jgi:hypothetical protein
MQGTKRGIKYIESLKESNWSFRDKKLLQPNKNSVESFSRSLNQKEDRILGLKDKIVIIEKSD